MNLVQIGTNEFFPQLIRLAANERHLQSRPYSNLKFGRRDQSAASSELFLSFTRRSFPTGTRDGGRREPCEPQPCSLEERNDAPCPDLHQEEHLESSQPRGHYDQEIAGDDGLGVIADERPPVLRRGPPVASSLRFGRPIGAHRARRNVAS